MKIKLLCALAAISLTACGSTAPTRYRMSFNDLNHYQLDCSRKDEQIAFLQSQYPSADEQRAVRWTMSSLLGQMLATADGSWDQNENVQSGATTSIIRSMIRDLENCPAPSKKELAKQKQGCVFLNENANAGASTGAQCKRNGTTQSRWEALVD